MVVSKIFTEHPRQSGKTTYLKQRALELYSLHLPVIFVSFNTKSITEVHRYFKQKNADVVCCTLDSIGQEISKYFKPKEDLPPEAVLINNGEIYILFDEYTLMNSLKLSSFMNTLNNSQHKFNIEGRTSVYK